MKIKKKHAQLLSSNIDSLENKSFFLVKSRMNELHVEKIYLNLSQVLGHREWNRAAGRVDRNSIQFVRFFLTFVPFMGLVQAIAERWVFFFVSERTMEQVSTQTNFNLVYRIKLVQCNAVGSFWEDLVCEKNTSMLFALTDTFFRIVSTWKIQLDFFNYYLKF